MAARTAARIFFKHLQLELIVNKDTDTLSTIIDKAFDDRASLDPHHADRADARRVVARRLEVERGEGGGEPKHRRP